MADNTYLMGIDGGGSTIRVVITGPDLAIIGQSQGPTANPSIVGRDGATHTIHAAVRAALDSAALSPDQIAAVGIGVAGTAKPAFQPWLREVVQAVTPQARIVVSADYEIALVGALGERRGVLVLAGTGSLAYGVNDAGASALVGGWGYWLGDEGSGYWLGIEGLRAVVQSDDGRLPVTALTPSLLGALGLNHIYDLVPWLYHADTARTHQIAGLAPLVMSLAAQGDAVAGEIVQRAAGELARAFYAVTRRLHMETPRTAFAGGLLTSSTPLSEALCDVLELPALPEALYPPVMGAALLARDSR